MHGSERVNQNDCIDCQAKGLYETCNHHEILELLEIMVAQLQEIIDAH